MKIPTLLAALVLGGSLLVPTLPAPPAAADAAEPITWPAQTEVVPNGVYYVHVDDADGAGTLVAHENGGPAVTLPHTGNVLWKFRTTERPSQVTLTVDRCTDAGCALVSTSPTLSLVADLQDVHPVDLLTRRPGGQDVMVSMSPFTSGAVSATWQVLDHTHAVVATSAASEPVGAGAAGYRAVPVDVPSDLVPGDDYTLAIDLVEDLDAGRYRGHVETEFVYRPHPASAIGLKLYDYLASRGTPTVYPAVRGYNTLRITASFPRGRLRDTRVDLLDARGAVVHAIRPRRVGFTPGITTTWNGKADGADVAPGRYAVRVSGVDAAGDPQEVQEPIRISDRVMGWKHVVAKIDPSASLGDAAVGGCSALRHRRHGALELVSRPCDSRDRGEVDTVHGVVFPGTYPTHYRRVQVTVNGTGQVKGHAAIGYFDSRGKLVDTTVLAGRGATHRGPFASGRTPVQTDGRGRQSFAWELAVFDGNRFTVTGYSLSYGYLTLIEPR